MVCSHSKGQFEGQKGQVWAFVIYCTNISETVHVIAKVYLKHIVSHIHVHVYSILVDLMTLTLDDL